MCQFIKRQRIPKGQSKKDNPKTLATYGTLDAEVKHNTVCAGHHYAQANTNRTEIIK